MDWKKLIEEQNLQNWPIGLGGCRISSHSFDVCEYDLTVFDEQNTIDQILSDDHNFIKIHHGSLKETNSDLLIKYEGLQIIQDESWQLRMFLAKIKEKKSNLYRDAAKNFLIESLFCCQKSNSENSENLYSSCWQKCASYFLAEAICALNQCLPGPAHMLDTLRKFEKNKWNDQISIVTESVGIERAIPSLLQRMLKSTIGFSEKIEKNDHKKIIQEKYDYYTKNSMPSDCYFYLGYINKNNFMRIKDGVDRDPNLIHLLKVAFDIESDPALLRQNSDSVLKSCNHLLKLLSDA